MFAQVIWFSTMIVGINVGWQPLPEGGTEYIIQLDPQSLEALKAGETILSDVPPSAGDVRTYKIIMGTKKLPRILPDTIGKPLPASSAVFLEPSESAVKSEAGSKKDTEAKTQETAKPWMPLILVSLGLFASFGGNMY
ncbi:MAG TPA: hypothetical protein VIH42_07910, partial [Thermoguttaceae bacterium]